MALVHANICMAEQSLAYSYVGVAASHSPTNGIPGALQYKPPVVWKKLSHDAVEAFARGSTSRTFGSHAAIWEEEPANDHALINPCVEKWNHTVSNGYTTGRRAVLESSVSMASLSVVGNPDNPAIWNMLKIRCAQLVHLFNACSQEKHYGKERFIILANLIRMENGFAETFELCVGERQALRPRYRRSNVKWLENGFDGILWYEVAEHALEYVEFILNCWQLITALFPSFAQRAEVVSIDTLDRAPCQYVLEIFRDPLIFIEGQWIEEAIREQCHVAPLFRKLHCWITPQINEGELLGRVWNYAAWYHFAFQHRDTQASKLEAHVIELVRKSVKCGTGSFELDTQVRFDLRNGALKFFGDSPTQMFLSFRFLYFQFPYFLKPSRIRHSTQRFKILYELLAQSRLPSGRETGAHICIEQESKARSCWRPGRRGPSALQLVLLKQGFVMRGELIGTHQCVIVTDVADVLPDRRSVAEVRTDLDRYPNLEDVASPMTLPSQIV